MRAAREAGVARFVLVSVPGAGIEAPDPFLRAKGLAEEAVAESGLEHAILRAAPVYGLGGLWFTAVVQGALTEPPFVAGEGEREVAPLFADDLAAFVGAVDDRPEPVAGTWSLEGPDVLTADGLVGMLLDDGGPPDHATGEAATARLEGLLEIPLSPAATAYLASAGRAQDAPDAAADFGFRRTPLAEGLRRTLERAGAG